MRRIGVGALLLTMLLPNLLMGSDMRESDEKAFSLTHRFSAEKLRELERRADTGDIEALRCLADEYFSDKEKSLDLSRRGAKLGDAEFQYRVFVALGKSSNPKERTEGLNALKDAGNQNYVVAQWNLAFLYEQGEIVTKNLNIAEKWYRKAAIQGDIPSLFDLTRLLTVRSSKFSALEEAYGWTVIILKRVRVKKNKLDTDTQLLQARILEKVKELGADEKDFVSRAEAWAKVHDRDIPIGDPRARGSWSRCK